MSEEYDLEDLKYQRTGYFPNDRFCDKVVSIITKQIPGDGVLPPRWAYKNLNYFTTKYGNLGHILWAKPASYHMLMIHGNHVFRVWTNWEHSCLVDLLPHLGEETYEIPELNWRKCKPFTRRMNIETLDQAERLAQQVKQLYGI